MIEATLGAKQTPPVKNDSPKYSLDVSNADFDVSYVNIAFAGAALGPYQNDQVGYVGTPMLPVGNTMNPGFRLLLQKFQALNNWPTRWSAGWRHTPSTYAQLRARSFELSSTRSTAGMGKGMMLLPDCRSLF